MEYYLEYIRKTYRKTCNFSSNYNKGEQVITLQTAQQLKTKNIYFLPGQWFFRQCKAKFLLETDSLY